MKTNWIKLSSIFLGTALVLSSCVKTDESPEVIELRKAAAAKLNADVAYRLAEVKYENAEATIRVYQAKLDSAKYLGEVDKYAAQAQVSIQQAKNQLLVAQIDFERQTKALEVEKLNNPVLTALIKDYTTYYNGGSLTSGQFISEGIFTLQNNILTENGTIIGLQNTKNGLAFLQRGKEISLAAMQIELTDLQAILKILGDARTSGNFDAALTAAEELLAKSKADYDKLNVAYDNASNLADAASAQWSAASNLYSDVQIQSFGYKMAYWDILDNYSFSNDETVAYNAMITANNNNIASESEDQALLTTWSTKYQTALTEKTTAQTAYNSARTAYLAAQAVVDAAQMNGGTATAAQIADRDAKLNAYNTADATYTQKSDNYDNVVVEYEAAKSNYENSKDAADYSRADVADYNRLKAAFTVEDSKLPALKTDMDAKSEVAFKAIHSRDSIYTLYENAESIMDNDESAVTLLADDRNNINEAISDVEADINSLNEDIAEINTEIANLKAGININNNNKLVDDQIKISQDKIAAWQELLTKYQAAAAALKVKIDAQ